LLAQEAVNMMMSIVGAEAGAMALRCLAQGARWKLRRLGLLWSFEAVDYGTYGCWWSRVE
jgi:hypothetical protein